MARTEDKQKLEWKKGYENTVRLFKEEFKKNPEDVETYEELIELNKKLWEKKHTKIPNNDFFYEKKVICLNCENEIELRIKKGEDVCTHLVFYLERYKEEKKCRRCGCELQENYVGFLSKDTFNLLKYFKLGNLLTEEYG